MAVSGVLGRTHGEGGFKIQRTSGEEHPQRGGQYKGWRVWRAKCWGERGGVSRALKLAVTMTEGKSYITMETNIKCPVQ